MNMVKSIAASDRAAIMHHLDRLERLGQARIFRLFFDSPLKVRCLRADPFAREYVGYDYALQGSYKEPFFFMHIADLQLGRQAALKENDGLGGSDWEVELQDLRKIVKAVNRLRPKFVVVSGDFTYAKEGNTYFTEQVNAL